MADTTWAVRVDEETKKEITELLNASGEQAKDFLISMLQAYKLKKAEESKPFASQDLKELRILLNRIQEIYYNLTQRLETALLEKDNEIEDIIAEKDSDIKFAQDMVEQLKKDLLNAKNELEASKATVREQEKKILELTELVNTTKALVQEYKEKNDMLTQLLSEYKGYKEGIEDMRNKLKVEQDAREKAEKENNEMLQLIEQMKTQYKQEVQKIKDSISIEHKKEIVDIQAKHQEEINSLHQSYNKKIEELNAKIHEFIVFFKPSQFPPPMGEET